MAEVLKFERKGQKQLNKAFEESEKANKEFENILSDMDKEYEETGKLSEETIDAVLKGMLHCEEANADTQDQMKEMGLRTEENEEEEVKLFKEAKKEAFEKETGMKIIK